MVGIVVSFWDGLFSGAFAVSFREGNWRTIQVTFPGLGKQSKKWIFCHALAPPPRHTHKESKPGPCFFLIWRGTIYEFTGKNALIPNKIAPFCRGLFAQKSPTGVVHLRVHWSLSARCQSLVFGKRHGSGGENENGKSTGWSIYSVKL